MIPVLMLSSLFGSIQVANACVMVRPPEKVVSLAEAMEELDDAPEAKKPTEEAVKPTVKSAVTPVPAKTESEDLPTEKSKAKNPRS